MKKLLFLPTLLALQVNAQLMPQWVDRFNGAGDFTDKVNAMTSDPSGNYYLAGYSTRPGNEKDFLVMKLAPNGDTLWVRTLDGSNHGHDEASDIAYDPTGNIVATGYAEGNGTGNDVFTVKLNLNGDTVWTRTYNYSVNQDDQANALAVDQNGNIVVTGQSDNDASTATNDDYITIRYTASGTQSWAIRYNGTALGTDRAVDVVFQQNGNAVVTGRSRNADDDFVTKAYTPAGTTAWTAIFDGGAGHDRPAKMVQDAAGTIFITGQSDNGNDYDFGTVAYSSAGSEVWRNFYDNIIGNDYGAALTLDQSGNLFVAGRCDVGSFATTYDIFVVCYTAANGSQNWASSYNGPGNGDDEATAIASTSAGSVIVTGKSDINSTVTVDNDIVTVAWSSAGVQQWSALSGVAVGSDGGTAILAVNSGNCIVAGNIVNTVSLRDIRRIEYNTSGIAQWTKDYDGIGDHADAVNAITTDAAGNSYMCGYTYSPANKRDICVIKVSPAGSTLWTTTYDGTSNSDDEANSIAVDNSGNVYITGFSKDTESVSGYNYCTIKYNSGGALQWIAKYDYATAHGSDRGEVVQVNASGEVFVTGESDADPSANSNYDITTIKYNASGAQQWVMRYNGSGNLSDYPYAMKLTPAGEIVVAGKAGITATNDDAIVLKYSAAGSLAWASINSSSFGNDAVTAIDIDAGGDIVAAAKIQSASLYNDIACWKITSTGGTSFINTWSGIAGGNDEPSDIHFDPAGNIYIAGKSDYDTAATVANYDALLLKYNATGTLQWDRHYDGAAADDDNATALCVDPATGYVYLAAQSQEGTMIIKNNNITVLQYDPSGTLVLTGSYDGNAATDSPKGILISNGNIYVGGTSTGAGNNQKDMVMLLFNSFNVGIEESVQNFSVNPSPNPCSDYAELHFNGNGMHEIRLLSVEGAVIFDENTTDETVRINTGNFAPGVYFGMITDNAGNENNFRLVKE